MPNWIKNFFRLYSAFRLEIKELKLFRGKISQKHGPEYRFIADNNTDNLINEVLVEKLKAKTIFGKIIKARLK